MPATGVLSLLILVPCLSCGFTGDASRHGDSVLVMNNMAEPGFLDPARQTGVEDQRITLGLFEGLLSYDPKTLKPVPGVAERWSVSKDGKSWRFELREAHWSDGSRLTSADFVYSWRRVLTPAPESESPTARTFRHHVSSPYADLLFAIRGARDYYEKNPESFESVGISAPDSSTLIVELENPTPWFSELLCFPTFMPVHEATIERHGVRWTRPENFVGNGPFVLAERRVGDSVRVERNPYYWDLDAVGLDAIVYVTTDQVDTALDQYLAGESDWVRGFNPKKVRAWRNDPELTRHLRAPEYLGTYFYRFNVRVPPLDDVRVRQALSLAVDRTSITRYLTALGEESAEGLVPPCITAFVPWRRLEGKGLGFDPERARDLLSDAGYPGGRGFPELNIAFNTDVKNRAIAEAVQEMWHAELGIPVVLENREKRVHFAEERAGRYMISRGSWIGDFNDPVTFLGFMGSTTANNRTGWKNAEFDRLLARGRRETDSGVRLAALQRAEEIVTVEEAALLPVFYYRTAYLLRPGRFEGIHENSRDLHPPKAIRRCRR